MRSSTVTSLADTINEWFDALDMLSDSAQEFVMDPPASPEEMEFGEEFPDRDGASSLEPPDSSGETDIEEEEEVAALVKNQSAASSDKVLQVKRRTQLPATQASDEGSLFAILKKNVGKVGNSLSPFAPLKGCYY
jgi:oxysterol-binding protein-related protein 3/6/7